MQNSPIAAVAHQLDALGRRFVALLLVPMAGLKEGQQKVLAVVGERVPNEVGYFKVVKISLQHQPTEVGRGHRLLRVEGGRVEGASRQFFHIFFGLLVAAESVITFYLFSRERRQLVVARPVILHAVTKVLSRLSFPVQRRVVIGVHFFAPLHRDKSEDGALPDAPLEVRLGQEGVAVGQHHFVLVARVVVEQRGQIGVLCAGNLTAVKIVTGRGEGVFKSDASRPDSRHRRRILKTKSVHFFGVVVHAEGHEVGAGLGTQVWHVTRVVVVVAVIVVIVQHGRNFSFGVAAKVEQQVAPLLVRVPENLLTGSGVNAGDDSGGLVSQTRVPAVSAERQILNNFRLFGFGGVLRPLLPPQLVGRLVPIHADVESARAHGHVCQF